MALYSVRIVAQRSADLKALSRFDLDLQHRAARQDGVDRFTVPGVLTDAQVQQVETAGYVVEVLADLSSVATERRRQLSPVNRFRERMTAPQLNERAVQGYMTVEEIESSLTNLVGAHPDLATLIELPHRTWEGRVCHAVRLRAGARPNQIGVFVTGSMHAREWGGSDICVNFALRIVNAYLNNTNLQYAGKEYTAAQVKSILENLELFIFPNVNPDGKHYSQSQDTGGAQEMWWRKNRNPNTSGGGTALGVDVNRNFDFLWSSGIGTSSNLDSFTYKGATAFSEPESRNVRHMLDTNPNIRYYVDMHSFGGLILYPWGDDNNQASNATQNFMNPAFDGVRGEIDDTMYGEFIPAADQNALRGLANQMNGALQAVRGTSYEVQQAVGLYPTSATSDDYAFSRHLRDNSKSKIYSFTIEFGQEFVPPYAEMKEIINEVNAALTELCRAVST